MVSEESDEYFANILQSNNNRKKIQHQPSKLQNANLESIDWFID